MGFFFQWFGRPGWMVVQRDREGVSDGVKTCSSLWDNYKRNSRRLLCFISPLRTPASLCLLACSECLLCVLTPHVMNWGIMDRVWGVRTHYKAHKMSISAVSQPFIHPLFIVYFFWKQLFLTWRVIGVNCDVRLSSESSDWSVDSVGRCVLKEVGCVTFHLWT